MCISIMCACLRVWYACAEKRMPPRTNQYITYLIAIIYLRPTVIAASGDNGAQGRPGHCRLSSSSTTTPWAGEGNWNGIYPFI